MNHAFKCTQSFQNAKDVKIYLTKDDRQKEKQANEKMLNIISHQENANKMLTSDHHTSTRMFTYKSDNMPREMAYWVRALAVQARGPEFKSLAPTEKVRHNCTRLKPQHRVGQNPWGLLALSLAPGSVRNSVSKA